MSKATELYSLAADFESAAEILQPTMPLLAAELLFEAGLARVTASWHRWVDEQEAAAVVRIAE